MYHVDKKAAFDPGVLKRKPMTTLVLETMTVTEKMQAIELL